MSEEKQFLNCYVLKGIKDDVKKMAFMHHTSMSSIVERAIAEFVQREKVKIAAINRRK